jgi:hypothetical protein
METCLHCPHSLFCLNMPVTFSVQTCRRYLLSFVAFGLGDGSSDLFKEPAMFIPLDCPRATWCRQTCRGETMDTTVETRRRGCWPWWENTQHILFEGETYTMQGLVELGIIVCEEGEYSNRNGEKE